MTLLANELNKHDGDKHESSHDSIKNVKKKHKNVWTELRFLWHSSCELDPIGVMVSGYQFVFADRGPAGRDKSTQVGMDKYLELQFF